MKSVPNLTLLASSNFLFELKVLQIDFKGEARRLEFRSSAIKNNVVVPENKFPPPQMTKQSGLWVDPVYY
jgi:hypothetical protein